MLRTITYPTSTLPLPSRLPVIRREMPRAAPHAPESRWYAFARRAVASLRPATGTSHHTICTTDQGLLGARRLG